MRTKKEVVRKLDPASGIEELAALLEVTLEDLLSMAKMQGDIGAQNQYSMEDAAFFAFLTGAEIGWKVGNEIGQQEGLNRRIDEIADRAYDEYRRGEEEDAKGSA